MQLVKYILLSVLFSAVLLVTVISVFVCFKIFLRIFILAQFLLLFILYYVFCCCFFWFLLKQRVRQLFVATLRQSETANPISHIDILMLVVGLLVRWSMRNSRL